MDLFDFAEKEVPNEKLTVLDLSEVAAKQYFLDTDSYCSIDLPTYFNFSEILKQSDLLLGKTFIKENSKIIKKLKKQTGTNYIIMSGKVGRYSWRELQLINPYVYVSLVNLLTERENWEELKKLFNRFKKNDNIKSCSLPLIKEMKKTKKASQILNWWHQIEQSSIEASLDFSYLFITDITDFYPSIYTHSIAWAVNGKDNAKGNYSWGLLGNAIDSHIQMMSNAQTNGIPQGSVLMDFIAEIILGYADEELTKKIRENNIEEYKILRYRDDYRIFVNNHCDGELILKLLTEVLMGLGLKLNPSKTQNSSDLILGSVKDDKIAFLQNQWLSLFYQTKQEISFNAQKFLLLLYGFSRKYPNSGALKRALNDVFDNIEIDEKQSKPLIAIATEIAFYNSQTYPVISALLSKFIACLNISEKENIINKIIKKFKKMPNTGYLDIWLQRITYPFNPEMEYSEKLCKILQNPSNQTSIWNFNFLPQSEKDRLARTSIINTKIAQSLSNIIKSSEFNVFEYDG